MSPHCAVNFDQSKACTNCLLPEPFARLDGEKVCHVCRKYKPRPLKGIDALKRVIQEKRGQGQYDAIMAVSGGRDSMYALYVLKEVLKLNVLAFHYNNEFVHDQAVENMRNAFGELSVDFVSVVSQKRLCRKIVPDLVRVMSQFGPAALETQLCNPCNVGGLLAAKKLALKNGISTVVMGNSDEEKLPDYIKKVMSRRIPLKKKIINKTAPYFFRSQFNKFLHRMEFHTSAKEVLDIHFAPGLEDPASTHHGDLVLIPFYDYVQWDRREIVSTIENKLNWKRPDGQLSSWRFDCRLSGLVNYLWIKACGFPKTFFGHIQMIRSRKMDRKEALEQLTSTDWGFTPELEDLLVNDIKLEQQYIDMIRSF